MQTPDRHQIAPLKHVSKAARDRLREDWRFRNIRDKPQVLALLRRMLENDAAGVREFAKQELSEYNAWLKAQGILPSAESGED